MPTDISIQADRAAVLGQDQTRRDTAGYVPLADSNLSRIVGGTVAPGAMLNVNSRAAGQHALATAIASAPTTSHAEAVEKAANGVLISVQELSTRISDLFALTKLRPTWLQKLLKALEDDGITIACENIVKYRFDKHNCPECSGRVKDERTDNGAEGREYREWISRDCQTCGWSEAIDPRELGPDPG